MLVLILICLDAYIQKIEILISSEIENMKVFITKLIAKNQKLNKFDKILKSLHEEKAANRPSFQPLTRRNSRASENLINNYKSNKELYRTLLEVSTNDLYENPVVGEDIKKSEFLKRFLRIFLKIDVRNRISKMENTNDFTDINRIARLFPKNLYVSFFTFLTKVFEELIVFLIILSALFKMNIFSVFYIVLVLIIQFTGKNYRTIYRLSLLISTLIITQALVFLSNISEDSDPHGDNTSKQNLQFIKEYLHLPWIDKSKENNKNPIYFFLSFGVNNYQVVVLWLEFLIIIFMFIYFDNFCYAIFQENENPYAFINFYYYSKHKKLKQSVNDFTEKKFEGLRKDLKNNFFIELPDYYLFLSKINKDYDEREALESQGFDIIEEQKETPKENFPLLKKEIDNKRNVIPISPKERKGSNIQLNKQGSINMIRKSNSKFFENITNAPNLSDNNKNIITFKNKKGKCYKLCEKMRKFMYLNMHNFTLILTLFLSMINQNPISIIYIGFVIFNLNKSYSIRRKKNFTFPSFIKTIFRLILIIDLLIQMINQFPFKFILITKLNINEILNNIGIYKLKSEFYGKEQDQINNSSIGFVLIKAITYFLLSVQVKIYASNDFKDFYLKYILKNNNLFVKKAIFNSFLHNNRLIEKMKKTIKSRESIDEFLQKLENQIAIWSSSNIIKKNSHLRLNNDSILPAAEHIPQQQQQNQSQSSDQIEKSLVSFKIDMNLGNHISDDEKESRKQDQQKTVSEQVRIKSGNLKNKINQLSLNINNSNDIFDLNSSYKAHNNNIADFSNIKDRLEMQFEEFFVGQNKTKQYFKEKIYSMFWIDFINIFNCNTSNFIFIIKENAFKFEKCTLKGDSYYKSSIEEKLDEEIEKINFADITTHEIEIILNNIDKAKKIHKKKISGKKKKIVITKTNKNKLKKRRSNLSNKDTNVIEELDESQERSDSEEDEIDRIFKEDQKIENVALIKYYRLLNNKIFDKYYKKNVIMFYIFYHIFEYILDNFQFICFFIMILNNIMNGSIISLVWPLIVFTIGIISNPRPSNIFWKSSMVYVSAIIMLKFMLQIGIDFLSMYYKPLKEFLVNDEFRIGFKYYGRAKIGEFINYIIWDCLLLFCLLIQQYILITNGLWKKVENEIESIKEAHERIFHMQHVRNDEQLEEFAEKLFDNHFDKMNAETKGNKNEKSNAKEKDQDEKPKEKEIFNNSKSKKNMMKSRDEEKSKAKIKHKNTFNASRQISNNLISKNIGKNCVSNYSKTEGNLENEDKENAKLNQNNFSDLNNEGKLALRKSNSIYINNNKSTQNEVPTSMKGTEINNNPLKDNNNHIKKLSSSSNINVNNYNRKNSFINKSNMLDLRFQQIKEETKENGQEKSKIEKEPENEDQKNPGIFKKFYYSVFPRIRVTFNVLI